MDPADPTARDRLSMWGSGLAMAQDHPLTGIGPGQVKHEYRRYAMPDALQKSRGHLHNTPLQILVERGALGLAAWGSIFVAFFWQAGRLLRALPPGDTGGRAIVAGSIAAITGFLVGGLTEYNFGDSEVVMVAYAVMALPFVGQRNLAGESGQ
ncbi:MAG: O-antigen ligase family protein [Candidatus Rokubacteria bacterium]|nr:O-antigen ligase family protein [Candidatus Rokubacteria bacterium]